MESQVAPRRCGSAREVGALEHLEENPDSEFGKDQTFPACRRSNLFRHASFCAQLSAGYSFSVRVPASCSAIHIKALQPLQNELVSAMRAPA